MWKNTKLLRGLVVALLVLSLVFGGLYLSERNRYWEERVRLFDQACYSVIRMTQQVDTVLKNNGQNAENLVSYVNAICFGFGSTLGVAVWSWYTGDWLMTYDQVFKSYNDEDWPEAASLLQEMNDELMAVFTDLFERSKEEKRRLLVRSSESEALNEKMKETSIRYSKACDRLYWFRD